jgi:SAM-dependent methyltransferase
MVHALEEAWRVVKPGGLLLDLRPAPVHRRVGIEVDGSFHQVAVMRERLDDDFAADRAVREVLARGLFRRLSRSQFDCTRGMPLKDFKPWLQDVTIHVQANAESLVEAVDKAYRSMPGRKRVVTRGPLLLNILQVVKN